MWMVAPPEMSASYAEKSTDEVDGMQADRPGYLYQGWDSLVTHLSSYD
jgi:hypothetical protein